MANFNCDSSAFAMPLTAIFLSKRGEIMKGVTIENKKTLKSVKQSHTKKTWNTPKTQAQPRSVKRQSAKTGIKLRSGVRAGDQIVFPDTFW